MFKKQRFRTKSLLLFTTGERLHVGGDQRRQVHSDHVAAKAEGQQTPYEIHHSAGLDGGRDDGLSHFARHLAESTDVLAPGTRASPKRKRNVQNVTCFLFKEPRRFHTKLLLLQTLKRLERIAHDNYEPFNFFINFILILF